MTDPHPVIRPARWWTISDEAIVEALHRVAGGEHPDIVHVEMLAASEREDCTDGDVG